MSFIQIKNISKIYKQSQSVQTVALNNITLDIEKGSFISVSGPSGSGKSTLLHIVGGLDSPSNGSVVIEGDDITKMSESELALERLNDVGFVFQAFNLIPVLSAKENIEYIMVLQGVDKSIRESRISKVALELGIEELLDKKPSELSGGQQQRVAVARAVVSKPKLILADEPTANLDSETSEAIIGLMKKINVGLGTTFIFSTHDPTIVELAEHIIRLHDGLVSKEYRKEEPVKLGGK